MSHPRGARLPSLERNILKYRALEMVLILFYSEALKASIIGSIKAFDRLFRSQGSRILPATKKKLQVALGVFVADGVITKTEQDEIVGLVDYRNMIAHHIQTLTGDIGRTGIAGDFRKFMGVKYDHEARKRLKCYYNDILRRAASQYCGLITMNGPLFEPAEKTYEDELKRLHGKICKQLELREEEDRRLKNELSLDNTGLMDEAHPYHPANKSNSGRLTKRGVEICYRLFDLGKSPIAVAYLMRISYKTAVSRLKTWEIAGGQKRKKVNLDTITSHVGPSAHIIR
jgi:hypothetical protein